MSLEYWRMKLNNCLVFHKNKYKRITHIQVDRESWQKDKVNYRFPEDSLPYMLFHFDEKDTIHHYQDFEIKFPNDQYVLFDKKANWMERSMGRSYKLAPSSENYYFPDIKNQLLVAFNQTPVYSKPKSLFDWKTTDILYTPLIASRLQSNIEVGIYFKDVSVAKVVRKTDHLLLKPTVLKRNIPKDILSLWEGYFNKKVPFKKLVLSKDSKGHLDLYYSWNRVDSIDDIVIGPNWRYFINTDTKEFFIRYSGSFYDLSSVNMLHQLIDAKAFSTGVRGDIDRMVAHYNPY